MSSYHTSFSYLNKNSYEDFKLQIVHFESGDNGEIDSYLSQDAIYQDSVRGTKRTMYGTKYNAVATLNITVMRPDGAEFSIEKTREINKWLTGATQYSWMDLYVGDEVKYRMHCFVQDVKPYKMDSRVVGFVITAESSSPWCYSNPEVVSQDIVGSGVVTIENKSDDIHTFTEVRTTFSNSTGKSLTIANDTTGEITTVNNLVANEVITLSENMFITSDKSTRIFGNDFNYVWPKLKAGVNNLTINGTGTITFEYIYPMKVVDCVGDLNAVSDPICNENGEIQIDMLDWSRVSNTPTTLDGYGILNAYTKLEIDNKFANFSPEGGHDQTEINNRLSALESQISDLSYKAISITSFTNNVKTVENGQIVTSVTLNWTVNKTPTVLTLDGVNLDSSATTCTYNNLELTKNKSWTLLAKDERENTSSKTTTVNFLNGVYYGATVAPNSYDSNFILSLTKQLSSSKVSSFTATSGAGQYFYYCLPQSMGVCSFNVGGFNGGFALVDTINFTNSYGHSENYYIYRSDHTNLGTKIITVS